MSIGRPVSKLFGQHLLSLRCASEGDEAVGGIALGRSLRDGPAVDVIKALAPDNPSLWVAFLLRIEPKGIGRAHAHPSGCHQSSWLGRALPPNRVLADLIELVESALHSRFCGECAVHLLRSDPVGQPR